MDFLRRQLEIPVPKVSHKESNSVGAEYITMEKASGLASGEIWWSLDRKLLLKVIMQLVK